MDRYLIAATIGLAAAFLWMFVATSLLRLFGVPLPPSPFGKEAKRAVQLLSLPQSLWFGLLWHGCGLFVGSTVFECLSWRHAGDPLQHLSTRIGVYAVMWPAVGLFIGWIHAGENRNRGISSEMAKQERNRAKDWDENGFSR